jgi:hypothetical protein
VNDWLAGGVLNGTSGRVSVLGEEKEGGAGVGRIVSLAQSEGIDSLVQRIKRFLRLDHGKFTLEDNKMRKVMHFA